MKKPHKFIKNFYSKVENMKQLTSILHYATIKCSTLMFLYKFYQDMKPLILKASSLLTLKLATTIKFIQVKTPKKL